MKSILIATMIVIVLVLVMVVVFLMLYCPECSLPSVGHLPKEEIKEERCLDPHRSAKNLATMFPRAWIMLEAMYTEHGYVLHSRIYRKNSPVLVLAAHSEKVLLQMMQAVQGISEEATELGCEFYIADCRMKEAEDEIRKMFAKDGIKIDLLLEDEGSIQKLEEERCAFLGVRRKGETVFRCDSSSDAFRKEARRIVYPAESLNPQKVWNDFLYGFGKKAVYEAVNSYPILKEQFFCYTHVDRDRCILNSDDPETMEKMISRITDLASKYKVNVCMESETVLSRLTSCKSEGYQRIETAVQKSFSSVDCMPVLYVCEERALEKISKEVVSFTPDAGIEVRPEECTGFYRSVLED